MIYKPSTYERIAESLIKNNPKPAPFALFMDGHLHVGTKSLHRTYASRTWRLFWRLKQVGR